jgi:hypothetical protein
MINICIYKAGKNTLRRGYSNQRVWCLHRTLTGTQECPQGAAALQVMRATYIEESHESQK